MFEKRCKICDAIVYQTYKLTSNTARLWYHCACGCMFNDNVVSPEEVFNSEYEKKLYDAKNAKDRYEYFVRVFAPLIEEKVYGRKMLDVGFGTTYIMEEMGRRGWITEGIEITGQTTMNTIKGNFETFDFWAEGKNLERYDLIWMGDVLQCFNDPVKAIYKAYNLLKPFGILMIVTPNTDLMRAGRVHGFGHWDMSENRQFLNESLVKQILDRCDESLTGRMRIVYQDPAVASKRFITCNNMHLMSQKFKIEDMPKMDDIQAAQPKEDDGKT